MVVLAACVREFVLSVLRLDQRVDGRRPFDARRLNVKIAREDGAAEVQLGQTHVMSVVSAQVIQPYQERPNEGTLAIYTEFSPMADPSFEPGRPGEYAVELGRLIDRGLRESKAVDMESLCILAGKAVWALRIDIHILDNGGNLVDAANIAALAALLSFRRPDCSVGGPDGQDITIHPPEMREPLPLIIHHLPIAVSFAFFGDGELVVMDPSFKEELVMGGRLTLVVNNHGDICAIQKGGGVGVTPSEILRCLRIAFAKAADITSSLKKAVEAHEVERTQRKIRRHKIVYSKELVKSSVKSEVEMKDVTPGWESRNMPASYHDMFKLEDIGIEDTSSDDDSEEDDDSESDDDERPSVEKTEPGPEQSFSAAVNTPLVKTEDHSDLLKPPKAFSSQPIENVLKLKEAVTPQQRFGHSELHIRETDLLSVNVERKGNRHK